MSAGAELPRPVVIRRIPALRDSPLYEPAFDLVVGLECGDHARAVGNKLIASLRDMDHAVPRAPEESAQLSFVLASPERTA